MTQPGRFITVEGIEGVGKSTNLAFVQQYLTAKSLDVVTTREPGGTPLAEEIRQLLLNPNNTAMVSDTELLLMFAARAQHLNEHIKPALEAGQWVLCDRFTDATYAYQGGGRGIDPERIAVLEQWVQGDLRPDLTIILDAEPELGFARVASRGQATDRFEQEKLAFFRNVRAMYLSRAQAQPRRYEVIDASQTLEQVQHHLRLALDTFLESV